MKKLMVLMVTATILIIFQSSAPAQIYTPDIYLPGTYQSGTYPQGTYQPRPDPYAAQRQERLERQWREQEREAARRRNEHLLDVTNGTTRPSYERY